MINPKIKAAIKKHEAEMIAFRRELHMHPELSWQEFETTKRIARELDQIGVSYRLTEPTGLIAEVKGGKPGKTVALRADIDALPVMEINEELEYKSTIPGKMHACGHDVHAAMLVAAVKALHEVKDELAGNVRFIFQPAEEAAGGAIEMVKQGALEGVDNVFSMHIWSVTPSGKMSCPTGASFAAVDVFTVKFKGRGGHGSMPHECVDAVLVAASFVMNVQAVISRETHPLDAGVVTIGKIEAGTRFNVIAENALLDGTVRSFSKEESARIEAAIRRFAEHSAAMYGATAEVEYTHGTYPVINEEKSAHLAQAVIKEAFGEDAVYTERPTTGGEDFCFYLDEVPGAFALVGTRDEQVGSNFAHHHGCFNVNEADMAKGAELYAQYAWSYLNQQEF